MGCRILSDPDNGACFYCSTTGWAFGPLMQSVEEAEAFVKFLEPDDPRLLTDKDMMSRYFDFRRTNVCDCGTVRDPDTEPEWEGDFGESYRCPDCPKRQTDTYARRFA